MIAYLLLDVGHLSVTVLQCWPVLQCKVLAISVLLLRVRPPTEKHKQEGPVLGRFGEHKHALHKIRKYENIVLDLTAI